nr:hypothetical protein [Chloroflexota bacterium]
MFAEGSLSEPVGWRQDIMDGGRVTKAERRKMLWAGLSDLAFRTRGEISIIGHAGQRRAAPGVDP